MALARRVSGPALAVTAVFVGMLATGTPERGISVRVWVGGLGLVASWAVLGRLRRAAGDPRHDRFSRLTDPPIAVPAATRPSFGRVGRIVGLAVGSAGDLHFRARPDLRDIARARLADRGIELDDPSRSAEVAERCGPVLWAVIRADRPAPDDRHGPGLDPADLPDLITHLEAL